MKKNYDLSEIPNYIGRKMFLDPAGGVTIQRFEELAYPKIGAYDDLGQSFFWRPQEVSCLKDKNDHKAGTDTTRFVVTQNILRQTALDSLQGRAPAQIFTPVASVPEIESLMSCWSFFETNIHSKSYSHIVRQIYNVPKDEFNRIHGTEEIIKMAASIGRYYDALHDLNCRKQLGLSVSEKEHLRAIWLALHASYGLEAIRFLCSFATSLVMKENKIYVGVATIIALILQDELLHTEWTAYLINEVVKSDPRFAEIAVECASEVYEMYLEIIAEEKWWAKHIMSKGVVVGLNEQILCDFVDHRATVCLKAIGIKYLENPIKNTPIPWFTKYLNPSREQIALQENEATQYLIGGMTSLVRYSDLPDL